MLKNICLCKIIIVFLEKNIIIMKESDKIKFMFQDVDFKEGHIEVGGKAGNVKFANELLYTIKEFASKVNNICHVNNVINNMTRIRYDLVKELFFVEGIGYGHYFYLSELEKVIENLKE
jgi:hypothetical protein